VVIVGGSSGIGLGAAEATVGRGLLSPVWLLYQHFTTRSRITAFALMRRARRGRLWTFRVRHVDLRLQSDKHDFTSVSFMQAFATTSIRYAEQRPGGFHEIIPASLNLK
jgi:hypothetical protein